MVSFEEKEDVDLRMILQTSTRNQDTINDRYLKVKIVANILVVSHSSVTNESKSQSPFPGDRAIDGTSFAYGGVQTILTPPLTSQNHVPIRQQKM